MTKKILSWIRPIVSLVYRQILSPAQLPGCEAWYVDRDLSWKGIERLMKKAKKWALKNSFTELGSDAALENTKNIAAHKALGFNEVDRVVCFLEKLV